MTGYRPSYGGIYRVDDTGHFELLHAFDYATEGAQPGALIEVGGAFYGVASNGGGGSNVGTLFRMDTDGVVTVLHRFGEPEGGGPTGPLLAASDGFLYGTTSHGGANSLGSVFKSDLSGNVAVVHSFAEGEGFFAGALVEGASGVFYGTSAGGAFGHGTVFRVDPSGTLVTLHAFTGGAGGSAPAVALLRTSDDSLYGTTILGGPAESGTVFRIDAAGSFEIVRGLTFADGKWPYGKLIEADGRLLGTAWGRGDGGVGTVFAVDATGEFGVVYSFRGSTEGSAPLGGLVQASDGDLYGATWTGGNRGYGTIYRLDLAGNFAGGP